MLHACFRRVTSHVFSRLQRAASRPPIQTQPKTHPWLCSCSCSHKHPPGRTSVFRAQTTLPPTSLSLSTPSNPTPTFHPLTNSALQTTHPAASQSRRADPRPCPRGEYVKNPPRKTLTQQLSTHPRHPRALPVYPIPQDGHGRRGPRRPRRRPRRARRAHDGRPGWAGRSRPRSQRRRPRWPRWPRRNDGPRPRRRSGPRHGRRRRSRAGRGADADGRPRR